MKQNSGEQLPHLTSEVVTDARGPELDAYIIALEGWRRGLTLKWYAKDHADFPNMKTWSTEKPGKIFSLSSGENTHYFFKTRGDKVTNQAVEICSNKDETKALLRSAGVRVPEGIRFTAEVSNEDIIKYVSRLGFPVVLKPTDGSFGRGVIANIESMSAFKKALNYLRSNLNYMDVVVERYIPGKDYRLYVVDDQVVAAIHRVPAHVIGDGVNSIKSLILSKNNERKSNPRLVSCLIKTDQEMIDFVLAKGYTFESIPSKGETVYLTDKSNISAGGDSIDELDTISAGVKETAVKTLKAIPGISHGAVDLIVEEVTGEAVVLEINPTAQIGSLVFPMIGQPRDVPAAIIDFYFPETMGIDTDREKIYYDFTDILEPLVNKKAYVTTVSKAPVGTIYSKRFIVSGSVQNIGYHRGLRKEAFERKLSGYIVNRNNGDIEVVVCGTNEDDVNHFDEAIKADPDRSLVHAITHETWNEPIKIGFEIKAEVKSQAELLKRLKEEKAAIKKEIKATKRKNKQLKESTSWKISSPIRKIGSVVKKIKK